MTMHVENDVTLHHLGCMMGNSNYTCIDELKEEQCTTLESGEKVSRDIYQISSSLKFYGSLRAII